MTPAAAGAARQSSAEVGLPGICDRGSRDRATGLERACGSATVGGSLQIVDETDEEASKGVALLVRPGGKRIDEVVLTHAVQSARRIKAFPGGLDQDDPTVAGARPTYHQAEVRQRADLTGCGGGIHVGEPCQLGDRTSSAVVEHLQHLDRLLR